MHGNSASGICSHMSEAWSILLMDELRDHVGWCNLEQLQVQERVESNYETFYVILMRVWFQKSWSLLAR